MIGSDARHTSPSAFWGASAAETGRHGEEIAAQYLLAHGFTLRHRNWRQGRYELDIVATKNNRLHFVEVKCRRREALTSPEDAITPAKFRALCHAARAYIAQYGIEQEVQFDLIAVEYAPTGVEVRYVPEAMIPHW